MNSVAGNKKNSNRLMHAMIGVSIVIHLFIFMHITGLYRSKAMSFIELTMQDISKPFSRSIPKPRARHTPPKVAASKNLDIIKPLPKIQMDMDPVKNDFSESLMEGLTTTPDIPDTSDSNISDFDSSPFAGANDYYEMIRLRIEKNKIYPEEAKSRYSEGRVKVQFIITADGQASSLKILKQSRDKNLDNAALNAIIDAAPFPRPPAGIFKGSVPVAISIIFELH